MSDNESYKVSIVGGGLTLERTVSRSIGEQVVMMILSGGAVAASPAAPPTPANPAPTPIHEQPPAPAATGSPHPSHGHQLSIREYLNDTQAKRVPDKIAAIGAFLATHQHKTDFTKADIIAQFEAASEPVPKNLPRDLKWTLKAGWIAERNAGNGSYYVTHTGQTAVKEKFSKDVVQKTRGITVHKPKKKSVKGNDA
jgi:hypothetical protein